MTSLDIQTIHAGGAPSSSRLAPGFRFHPTDEELVSYYLKRRIAGRRLLVDAISEIEIYKHEPWDLPSRSRLQSRDLEWYFFSPLDRKYANRSRTNRATAGGYWKTTGKDRPVRHGGRVAGMKKTLVFHAGRAPRGERTNWVMHEYRLKDEEIPRSCVQQDGLVVCRIFQKNGAGPQNGAQYGAPFLDEEWEEEEEENMERSGHGMLVPAGDQEYNHMNDFVQVHESHQADLSPPSIDVADNQTYSPPLNGNDGPIKADGDNLVTEEMFRISPSLNGDFVELNDLVEDVDVKQPLDDWSQESVGIGNDRDPILWDVDNADPPEIYSDEFFDILNESFDDAEPIETPSIFQNDVLLPNGGPFPASHGNPLGQPAENGVLYEWPSQNIPSAQPSTVNENGVYPPMVESSAFDLVDEWMHYFDATGNDMNYNEAGPAFAEFVFNAEVDDGCNRPLDDSSQDSGKDAGVSSPSPTPTPTAANASSSSSESNMATKGSDLQQKSSWDKSFKSGLVNMLDSFSAPQAMAAESPVVAASKPLVLYPAATISASSIHISTGMIHLSRLTFTAAGSTSCLKKNALYRAAMKIQGRVTWMVLRSWMCLFIFSTMIIAACLKFGSSLSCAR